MPIKLDMPGLKELQAALKNVAPEAKREFQAALKAVGQIAADEAAADIPRRTGKAKRSVKVKIVQRRGFEGVQITEGGAVAPYTPWLDFGGSVGRGRRTTARVMLHGNGRVTVRRGGSKGTGSTVRPYLKGGRYLYPAYERRYDDMTKAALESVRKAAMAAGFEVTTR